MLMRNRFLALAMLTVGSLLGCSKPSDPSKPAAPTPSKATDKAAAASTDPTNSDTLDRTTLPIPEPNYPHSTVLDARNATPPPRFKVKAPSEAPNVLVVLIDDMGFGMSSAFGGPISMPTLDRLAEGGLRFNHFHTTALCSPTRAALLPAAITTCATWGRSLKPLPPFLDRPGSAPTA